MAAKNPKPSINLDLLHPQSSPEKIPVKFLKWLLSSGRYMFIFVEALVLVAFVIRFKLDADIANKKEEIEQQVPFIEQLKPYEVLIKQTQLKLSSIKTFYSDLVDYPQILKKIADQTPIGVKILSITMEKTKDKINLSIVSETKDNNDVSNFVFGLKQTNFGGVNLTSIGLDQGIIRFTIILESEFGG